LTLKNFNDFIAYNTENIDKVKYDVLASNPGTYTYTISEAAQRDVAYITYTVMVSVLRQYHQWLSSESGG
jgi:hypothetical protein